MPDKEDREFEQVWRKAQEQWPGANKQDAKYFWLLGRQSELREQLASLEKKRSNIHIRKQTHA